MAKPPNEETGVAARMLVGQMQRERRSFWGILAVFFLLLAGIGGMLGYQIFALRTFAEDSRAQRFKEIGMQSKAMMDLRRSQDESAVKLREAANQTSAAQAATEEAWKALRDPPEKSAPRALAYAKQHFLGRPLNQSTALVLTGALQWDGLPSSQAALMRAALLDWSTPTSMLVDTVRPEQMPKLEAVRANADVLLNDPAPQAKLFGHAAMAAHYYRQASNGRLRSPPLPFMDWENGCKELVEHTTAALEIMSSLRTEEATDPEASGLNLHYGRGQCWRKQGETQKAFKEYETMMRLAGTDAIPPSNPIKYQAFHGMGTAVTTLLEPDQKSDEQAARAKDLLTQAGKFRRAAGTTEVGEVSSTANIGFLLLKTDTPEGLVAVLKHTEAVDEILPSTWNLVAQLAAIRAMQGLDEDQRATLPAEAHSDDKLGEMAFQTLAELAYQQASSLPEAEFRMILDKKHHPALEQAKACIGQREDCYQNVVQKSVRE